MRLVKLPYSDIHELLTKACVFMGVPAKPTRLPKDSFKSRMDFSKPSAELQLWTRVQSRVIIHFRFRKMLWLLYTWYLISGNNTLFITPNWIAIWYLMVQCILLLILSSSCSKEISTKSVCWFPESIVNQTVVFTLRFSTR